MKRTFEILRKWMEKNQAVEVVPGRDTKYSVPDAWEAGVNMLQSVTPVGVGKGDVNDEENYVTQEITWGRLLDDAQLVANRLFDSYPCRGPLTVGILCSSGYALLIHVLAVW